MAYIKVNHQKFEATAKAFETYKDLMETKMNTASSLVNTNLHQFWTGSDAEAFKQKWGQLQSKDSTFMKMQKSIESYCEFLRNASKKYKDAQINAVNRANGLPKY